MALFGRGNDPDSLLRKIESKSYKGPAERRELISELAAYGTELRPDVLLRLLTEGEADLGRLAIEEIGRRGDTQFLDPLLSSLQQLPRSRWRVLIGAIHGLKSRRLGQRLAALLGNKRASAREAALEVIAAAPDWKEHLPALKQALRDDEAAVRARAVSILGGDLSDESLRMFLRELMHSQDEVVREAAISTLARRPHPDLIEDFFDLLPNVKVELQNEILAGLRRMISGRDGIPEDVLNRILPLLAADDVKLRQAAAQLLMAVPDKLDLLRRFCRYATGIAFWLRDRAFEAISGVADDLAEAVLTLLKGDDLDSVVGAVNLAAKNPDPRMVEALTGLLESDHDWWIKVPALEKLALFPQREVSNILVAKLEDEELRTAALASLGQRADPATLPAVARYLEHRNRSVRRAALSAVDGYGDPDVLPTLERIARTDEDAECRQVALEMLDRLGAEGVATAAAIRETFKSTESDKEAGVHLTMLRGESE